MPRVITAAGSQIGAEAGAALADAGGNAVDAAIAAVLVSLCTEPGIVAPGAGAFITTWGPKWDPVTIDAYGEMPGRGLGAERFGAGEIDAYIEYGGGTRTLVGYGSVATPGAFAGLEQASRTFGAVPWKELFQPAIHHLRTGFPLSEASGTYLSYAHEVIFGWHPESYRLLHNSDGRPLQVGDLLSLPQLADTLERVATLGVADLYTGELAGAIVAEVEGNGGLVTADDLASYRPVPRQPIRVHLGDWEVATNPPPAVGGATLAAMLLLADAAGFDGWTAEGIATLLQVQEAVMGYRRGRLDIEDDTAATVAELLERARLGDLAGILASPSTVHVSAVDAAGHGCAITASAGYGSGVVVPGTGFWLNNSLGELELHPQGFHGLAPGTRLPSNMAPSVGRRHDGAVLAVGSPGADRITTALMQTFINYLRLGMPIAEAVAHPRVHAEVFDGEEMVAYEADLPLDDSTPGRRTRHFPGIHMYFGGVQAAAWSPDAGLAGTADPRRAGAVATGGSP